MTPARSRSERGAASVEQAALSALIALIVLAAITALAAGPTQSSREIGATIARRLACAPRLPDACHHHPLVPAYGWPLARLVRALAPLPVARPDPAGRPLVPVDFRRCRRPSCAVPLPGAAGLHLTASGRRTTAFTSIEDLRRSRGYVEISYWLYRPSIGWEKLIRRATQIDIDAAAGTRVLLGDDPNLVPLETLPGRNHYVFGAGEEPPWRWQVEGRHSG